ncbi:MAG: hydantoinase/oxoprolinase family protein, partial [Chloroflexi bacterium]|nr:hydantoinase/oxoprolinase family protein [Chloroflexota bacterium]
MSLILGVDTGGTFTDAVLLDADSGTVTAAHKALTTHENLAVGIEAALDGLPADVWPHVHRAALSTTLATNAALEGLGSRVGCILIGYDPGVMRHYRLDRHVRASAVAHVGGRHDIFGEEVTPLDENGLCDAVKRLAPEVDALAVSSYLAPRNPDHERRAVRLVSELTSLPVVAGGALSSQINSIRRATTATLNAKLLAVTSELLDTLEHAVRRRGVSPAPMVVRG